MATLPEPQALESDSALTTSAAPWNPAFVWLTKDTILYRGSESESPFEPPPSGRFFTENKATADEQYAAPYLRKYIVKDDVKLVNLMNSETRKYLQSFQRSADSAYEQYISPAPEPVAANSPHLPEPRYADAPEIPPKVQELLESHGFGGWRVPEGFYRMKPLFGEMHTEVMLLDPEHILDFQQLLAQ